MADGGSKTVKTKTARPISTVLFDAGNTLLRPVPGAAEIYAEVANRYGFGRPLEEIRRHLKAALAAGMGDKLREEGSLTPESVKLWWREFVAGVFGVTARDEKFDAFFEELYVRFTDPDTWVVFDDVLPTLRTLREAGLRLAVVSNWDYRLPGILQAHGVSAYLDAIVVSTVEGFEKPHPRLFEIALARVGSEADTALHVGDSLADDVRGAERAGVRAILLDRGGDSSEFPGERIRSLAELPALLGLRGAA